MNYWLVKSPFKTRSWPDLLMKGVFKLYGIRNYLAKKNIASMKPGDKALYYHSPSGKKIYGIMRVTKPPYYDPSTLKKGWLAIDFEPVKTFSNPITLLQIKSKPLLKNTALVKQSRLSVMPLTRNEFDVIVKMGASS